MLADMTTLKNRILLFGINSTPTIATVFAGSKIADLFYNEVSWRWAFGAFLIIMVAVCIPVAGVFIWSKRKAQLNGLMVPRIHNRTTWESVKYYVIEFDGESTNSKCCRPISTRNNDCSHLLTFSQF